MSETQAGKYIPENWMDPNNKNCPVIKCNYCSHQAHPILLRIHLFQTHMKGIFLCWPKKNSICKILFSKEYLLFLKFSCIFLNPNFFPILIILIIGSENLPGKSWKSILNQKLVWAFPAWKILENLGLQHWISKVFLDH